MNPSRIYLTALILLLLAAVPLWADQAPAKPTTISQEMPTPRQQGEHWGYVNAHGDFVIRPIFDSAEAFSEGVAAVCLRQTISVVTNSVSERNHKNIEELCGFINPKGVFVILPQFGFAGTFSEGLAPVQPYLRKGGPQVGFIDRSGRMVIKPQFDAVGPFIDGRAFFVTGGIALTDPFIKTFVLRGYIDPHGRRVFQSRFRYFFAYDFSERLVPFRQMFGTWGYMDPNGKIVIHPRFNWAGEFSHGRAAALLQGHCVQIDRSGKIIGSSVESHDSYTLGLIRKHYTFDFPPRPAPCSLQAIPAGPPMHS